MPRISVIIPAHNVERYVAEAIDSVLNQTLTPAEVVIVDDGSNDRTGEIASRYGQPVKVISQRVGGSGPARNLAVRNSTGDWLAFLDADDIWLPEKLERQFAKVGPETRFVCSDRYNFGDVQGMPEVHGELQPQREGDVFEILLREGNFIVTSSVVLRRDAFIEAGGFPIDEDLMVAQDWDLWMRVTALYPIVACHEPLVRYRLHPGGSSRQLEKMLLGRQRVVERALNLPKGRGLSWLAKRRIWAETHRTNGWDAARSGRPLLAVQHYARSMATLPLQWSAYEGMLRAALGRS